MKNPGRYLAGLILCIVLGSPFLARRLAASGATKVDVSVVKARSIQSSVDASGTFSYEEEVDLSPEILGRVAAIYAREGAYVLRGQPLLQLETSTYASQVSQREASVTSQSALLRQATVTASATDRRLGRVWRLKEIGFASVSALQDAEESANGAAAKVSAARADLSQAQAALFQARQTLDKTIIRAPVDGMVVTVTAKPGATVVPSSISLAGSSLLTIAGSASIIASIDVDEADVGGVRPGQRVSLTATAFPDKPLAGRVTSIAFSPGREGRRAMMTARGTTDGDNSFSVRVRLESLSGLPIRSGMTCRVQIYRLLAHPLPSVPVEAVRSTPDAGPIPHAAVLVVQNGRVVRKSVKVGQADDRFQSIVSGLKLGEHVVTGPAAAAAHLSVGDRVDVR